MSSTADTIKGVLDSSLIRKVCKVREDIKNDTHLLRILGCSLYDTFRDGKDSASILNLELRVSHVCDPTKMTERSDASTICCGTDIIPSYIWLYRSVSIPGLLFPVACKVKASTAY